MTKTYFCLDCWMNEKVDMVDCKEDKEFIKSLMIEHNHKNMGYHENGQYKGEIIIKMNEKVKDLFLIILGLFSIVIMIFIIDFLFRVLTKTS